MPTLWNDAERAELLKRLDMLTPSTQSKWGKLDCKQMLAHLSDSMRMAMGEISIKPRSGLLRTKLVRYLIIHVLPFPKGAPTAPELISRQCQDPKQELIELKGLIAKLATNANQTNWPEHPAFGALGREDWGVLNYRHIDHHLRQFGA